MRLFRLAAAASAGVSGHRRAIREKTMETRFFAPGSLVSNLDFVEGIFGNGGDPYLPENDAALDAMHWTGHTGCVILAPHLAGMKKKDLGLPHFERRHRTPAPRWHVLARSRTSLTTAARPFKITCRDQRGVMVTIIADNYYGYCKKEVKTQISFAANLFGHVRRGACGRRHRVSPPMCSARISTPAEPSA